MLIALVSLATCRKTETAESVATILPRTFEARISDQVAYEDCGVPSEPRGALQPTLCSPPTLEEVRAMAGKGPGTDSMAAAVRRIDLSPTESTLRRALEDLTPSQGAETAGRLTASGALYHALAQETGDPSLLVEALEWVEHAVEIDPASLAALFNRALVQGDLGLCRQARESWHAYFDLDRSSEWADEGRVRLLALPCGEGAYDVAKLDTGSVAPGERDRFFDATLEVLLPRWLEQHRNGAAESERELRRISGRADRLLAGSGDPWLRELADELRHHAGEPGYLRAVGEYTRGYELFREERYRSARSALAAARPALGARDSVLLPWCDLWIAGIDIYMGRFQRAEARLIRQLRDPVVERSPKLSGRLSWARGLAAIRAGRRQDAYDRYAEAARAFERGGYLTSIASIQMLQAEVLSDLGFVAESWRDRVAALRALQGSDPHFMLRNALLDGATVAGAHGAPRAAGAMLDEVQALADESDDAATAAEALLFRGEVMLDAGEANQAREAFRDALDTVRDLDQALVRERLETHARLGLWATGGSPRDLSGLEPILRFYSDKGPPSLHILALRVKARLAQESGRDAVAREAVAEAIREIRRAQSDLRDESFELRYWETAQSVFDEAIFRALDSTAPLEALSLLEEARDLGESERGTLAVESCTPAERGRTYPIHGASSLVLGFGVAGDELAWWRLDGDRCLYGRGDARRSRVAVERWGTRPGAGLATEDLDRLYEDLLAAPLRGVPPGTRLRIVPDRHLLRVPFAALRNSRTGLHLVEEHTLSFHQDVASALRADREPRDAPPRGSWSVLAVGDPAFDRRFLPWLQPLPGARAEAEAVAALYTEGSELLLGPDATLDRLREGSPGRQVLHIAAHAVTSPGGLGDGLVLAGDGAAGGSSGLSSVRDLAPAIPPGLELVVLSGCSTLGTTPTRSSGLAGLARPFVSQGVPAVVGTLWPVDDRLLNDLMTKFHAGILAGASASDALRQAQLDLLSASADAPCCDWAAVQLFGELPPADPDTMERGGS